jgi:HTH-type transcriptional regulator/antitoxin HigA
MTLTLNKIEYGTLLADIQPKVILTEEENDRALNIVQNLLAEENLLPEKEQIIRLLVSLIEKFEDEHYPLKAATPRSTLLHLIEERDIQPIDLTPIIGSEELVSEIISGKISISQDQAKALGDFFHVEPIVFIDGA